MKKIFAILVCGLIFISSFCVMASADEVPFQFYDKHRPVLRECEGHWTFLFECRYSNPDPDKKQSFSEWSEGVTVSITQDGWDEGCDYKIPDKKLLTKQLDYGEYIILTYEAEVYSDTNPIHVTFYFENEEAEPVTKDFTLKANVDIITTTIPSTTEKTTTTTTTTTAAEQTTTQKVEEATTEKPISEPSEKESAISTSSTPLKVVEVEKSIPNTGNSHRITVVWAAAIICIAVCAIVILVKSRKQREKN